MRWFFGAVALGVAGAFLLLILEPGTIGGGGRNPLWTTGAVLIVAVSAAVGLGLAWDARRRS